MNRGGKKRIGYAASKLPLTERAFDPDSEDEIATELSS
jgi:hypothetical protein